jgi:hypothetical protein
MAFNKDSMIGRRVRLYPNDTYRKIALIKDISDLGYSFEITESEDSGFKVGRIYFYSHAKPIILEIL